MLLSISQSRLELCRMASKIDILEGLVGQEVIRVISTYGIEYIGATREQFNALTGLIPSHIRARKPTGMDIGSYEKGAYVLDVSPGELGSISHKLLLSRKYT